MSTNEILSAIDTMLDYYLGEFPEHQHPEIFDSPCDQHAQGLTPNQLLEIRDIINRAQDNLIPDMPVGYIFLSVSRGVGAFYAEIKRMRTGDKKTAFGRTPREAVMSAIAKKV